LRELRSNIIIPEWAPLNQRYPSGLAFETWVAAMEPTGFFRWKPRMNQRGVNDVVLFTLDERGLVTSHEFQIHVFEDLSSQQFVSISWPLLLAFVGTMFTIGITALR